MNKNFAIIRVLSRTRVERPRVAHAAIVGHAGEATARSVSGSCNPGGKLEAIYGFLCRYTCQLLTYGLKQLFTCARICRANRTKLEQRRSRALACKHGRRCFCVRSDECARGRSWKALSLLAFECAQQSPRATMAHSQ